MKHLKFLKKFFENKTFEVDGYKYFFKDVQPKEDFANSVQFIVVASLPKQGQSYSAEKMSQDINKIIDEGFKFMDEIISYGISFSLDTDKGDEDTELYIREELKDVLLLKLNKDPKLSVIELPFIEDGSSLIFNLYYFNPEIFDLTVFEGKLSNDEIEYYTIFKVQNIRKRKNGSIFEVEPNPEKLNELAGALQNQLVENNIAAEVENLLYDVLENELRISNSDIYYVAHMNCKFIGDVEVKPMWNFQDFEENMFIS